jgi:hypothetical protein
MYRIPIDNIENEVLTYCRRDGRMALVETNKNLVGLLLILRSVCAQNKGNVKFYGEYQNLITLHSALAYKQKKSINNTTFGEDILNRCESAVFTCGKFAFGQSAYDKVLAKYSTPMTFAEYMLLSDDDQSPIDNIVKERTAARLMIKNSMNEKLREHLVQAFSVNNNTCYPNNISDAVSLLSTFAKTEDTPSNVSPVDDAVASYHESIEDLINTDSMEVTASEDNDVNNDRDIKEEHDSHVTFNALSARSAIWKRLVHDASVV